MMPNSSDSSSSVLGPLRFILLVNKQGQTRLSKYYVKGMNLERKAAFEGGIVRGCLSRSQDLCSFFKYENYKIIYRRYASLFFVIGVEDRYNINELLLLEFIHSFVETLDKYFKGVCELDLMFNLEKAHFILEEIINPDGEILDCNRTAILAPLDSMDIVDMNTAESMKPAITTAQVTSAVGDLVGRVRDYMGGGSV